MAYENITLRKANVTMIDGYFYMIDDNQDAMIVKTDDGTQAYSYPLDTTLPSDGIGSETPGQTGVVSMEFDGRNFWTLENPGGNDVRIKRWNLENYILKLRDTFDIVETAQDKFNSEAMTVEHYHLRFHGNADAGASVLSMYQPKTKISDVDFTDPISGLTSGMTISLGPNASGQREDREVSSISEQVTGQETVYNVFINGSTTYDYKGPTGSGIGNDYRVRYGDPASFYTRIWLFNNFYGTSSATGALYWLEAYTNGDVREKYPGGEYKDVKACTFFDVPNYIFDRTWQDTPPPAPPSTGGDAYNWPKFDSIAYTRTTNTIFLNPRDFSESYGSMTMDNVEDDQATVIPLYDLTMEGVNVYRLQRKATYYGTTAPFSDDAFSYQLSTLEPFITSISLRANPAILPANGVNTSQITAVVKDQFNLPIGGKSVYFTDDDPSGSIGVPNPAQTNADGVAATVYTAGNSAREVKITATAEQGGIETPTD